MAFMVHEHEKPALEEFRDIVKDLTTDERVLVRFLRARNLNAQKAEQMLRKSMEWRNNNDMDSIIKYELPVPILKDFKMYYCGTDAEKRPIYLLPIGQWDGRKILSLGLKDDACRFMYKVLEIIMEKCKSLGVTQFHTILDYEGLTFWKVAHWESIQCVLRVVMDFEANFPETLYQAHFVNAPTVFWQAFKAVKPILAQTTMDKIHIFDSDRQRWLDHILQWIPKESLPMDYGGSGKAIDFYPTYAEAD